MSMSVQLTPQELQLISDALSSHRTWLTRTLEKSFVHHLNNRLNEIGEVQGKIIAALKAASASTR